MTHKELDSIISELLILAGPELNTLKETCPRTCTALIQMYHSVLAMEVVMRSQGLPDKEWEAALEVVNESFQRVWAKALPVSGTA